MFLHDIGPDQFDIAHGDTLTEPAHWDDEPFEVIEMCIRDSFEGVEVAVAVFRQIRASKYRVEETEKAVKTDSFRGKIDRIDGTDKYAVSYTHLDVYKRQLHTCPAFF